MAPLAMSPFIVGMPSYSTTIQKISRADAVQGLGVLRFYILPVIQFGLG